MEPSSLVEKHMRSGIEAAVATTFTKGNDTAKNIITAAVSPYSSDGEDGPYFDLEFTLPEEEEEEEEPTEKAQEDDQKFQKKENGAETGHEWYNEEDSDHEKEVKLKSTVLSDGCTDENATTSSELLVRGESVPIESSSFLVHDSDHNCKFPVSLLKSAAKFGVVLLKLKKSKPEPTENISKTEENKCETGRKLFAFRILTVEEGKLPFTSLFRRENDSKAKKQGEEMKQNADNSEPNGVQEDRKLSKQHYFKLVKPLSLRISKGYVGKLKFHEKLNIPEAETGGGIPPPDIGAADKGEDGTVKVVDTAVSGHVKTGPKPWMQMGLLAGKSRPSAAVVAVPAAKMACNRRDDSLLQVQDGIQGAILHCKRSFNASIDS